MVAPNYEVQQVNTSAAGRVYYTLSKWWFNYVFAVNPKPIFLSCSFAAQAFLTDNVAEYIAH